MKRILLFSLLATQLNSSMIPRTIKQLAIIKPFFKKTQTINTIKNVIDTIDKKELTYPDYSQRTGIIWSDFWVDVENPNILKECTDTVKITRTAEGLQKHDPESVFHYPHLREILCHNILPKTFDCITTNKWAPLPKKVFVQFFLQRSHISEPMDWHQDPGEDYDTMADFSLILMLSKQSNPAHGWQGGEFAIRPGLPLDPYNEADINTIAPEYNCALLFNNKINSHRVTAITTATDKTKRDIIVIPIFLTKPPMPILI